jgi:hypothetical protein
MSKPLRGIPRAFKNHKNPDGFAYRAYVVALKKRLPGLPTHAAPTLREAGLTVVDLTRARAELEELRARRGPGKRKGQERRVRAEQRKLRVQLLMLERRLEDLAARPTSGTGSDALDQMLEDLRHQTDGVKA